MGTALTCDDTGGKPPTCGYAAPFSGIGIKLEARMTQTPTPDDRARLEALRGRLEGVLHDPETAGDCGFNGVSGLTR